MAALASAGTVGEALGAAADALAAAGAETPRLDAEVLLAEATGVDRGQLLAGAEDGLPAGAGRRFGEMVRRRLRREPVAYILGRKGFRKVELAVDRRVLIPRPETELLVEVAVERRAAAVLDVGTGSGAIALAIADEMPGCEVTAIDTSPLALEVARANAERLGLSGRVRFVEGTLPAGGGEAASGSDVGEEAPQGKPVVDSVFDLVVANLPYVPAPDWPTLQPEIRDWEPREAFLAGPDGLDAIRALVADCGRAFARNAGRTSTALDQGLALEVGMGQAERVAGLLREAGFELIETRRDLAGIERVVIGQGGRWGDRSAAPTEARRESSG